MPSGLYSQEYLLPGKLPELWDEPKVYSRFEYVYIYTLMWHLCQLFPEVHLLALERAIIRVVNTLSYYGWTEDHAHAWNELGLSGLLPARVLADYGTSLKLATPEIITAELSGKLAHYSRGDNIPKVGDWVAVHVTHSGAAVIESVVLRRNEIARKVPGKQATKQILAANIDVAFVLLALDNDFSIERLQRFLYQLSVSGISPVIVLNKVDKTNDVQHYIDQLGSFDLPIIVCSATRDIGIDEIANSIHPAQTAILLGSSGVGKSTLTNKLLQRDAQQTGAVRESDATGRHTTVHRELFLLPNGGLLVDTPGIRELQLWGTEEDLENKYKDIADLSERCRYSDCQHAQESGCAIRKALQNGKLDKSHYANYLKMKSELAGLAERQSMRAKRNNKRPRQNVDWHQDEE